MEDVENRHRLFELTGVHFRLPVWAIRSDQCVRVSLTDIPLLPKQRSLIVDTVSRLCRRKTGSEWILDAQHFSQWFVESNQSDPEDVVVWNWTDPSSNSGTSDDFIHAYCKSRGAVFTDPNFATIVWASLQHFALWWVLTKNRPLDLGFVKLESIPARRNWLAILASKRQQGIYKWKDVESNAYKLLKKTLSGSKLTGWDADHQVIRWDLHATPLEPFHKAARLIELQRKQESATVDYLVAARNVLISHYPRIHDILETYMAETNRKNIRVPNRRSGRDNLRQYARLRQIDAPRMDSSVGVSGILEEGESEVVEGKDANLLSVSDISALCPDVRRTGTDVADPEEPESNRAVGLPLLHATEGEVAGELLAFRPGSGVDADSTLGAGVEQLSAATDRNGEEQ